jgi:hypothetical protein
MGFFNRKDKGRTRFQRKQELAHPARYYGDGGTLSGSGTIDIRINSEGVVEEVWFRCQQLPFRVDAGGLIGYSSTDKLPYVTGVEVLDQPDLTAPRAWGRSASSRPSARR